MSHTTYSGKTSSTAALALLLGIAASGCGDDTTGTPEAMITVEVHDRASDELVIEKELQESLQLDGDADVTIAFDVHSEAWVTEENLDATVVEATEIRSATTLSAQSG